MIKKVFIKRELLNLKREFLSFSRTINIVFKKDEQNSGLEFFYGFRYVFTPVSFFGEVLWRGLWGSSWGSSALTDRSDL